MTKGFASADQLPQPPQPRISDQPTLTSLNEIQANLLNYVASVPDPRVARTQKHNLKDILVIAILAVIGGDQGWEDIECL
ncbi:MULTISPECIES: ISAs1 family transposase [Planktothricoides]|uniref:ISAs1 family transposase n=1 Tax=Planktothricoides sp. SR001 TaxID=1705388 RepID=UPI0006C51EFB|nr:hypothetical protein AM228_07690 [Planktothricoides sp. SR001]